MNSLTVFDRNGITATSQQITPDLLTSYVAWIDRSEKTTKTYLKNLKAFWAWLRYSNITQPVREDIISYRQWLITEHDAITLCPDLQSWTYRTDKKGNRIKVNCKPNTVAQYLRSVCQFFRWTAATMLYPNIAENIHAPKVKNTEEHRRGFFEAGEILNIEHSITEESATRMRQATKADKDTAGMLQRATEQSKRLYAMFLLTTNAGLRTIELSRANVKDLEIKGGQAKLYIYGKGHTEADTGKYIAPEVAQAITDYLEIRTDNPTANSPLFVATGNRNGGKRLASTTISTMLKKAMIQAGYNSEKLTAHSLRHSTGTAVMTVTNDLYTAQHYLRHANPATTERYLHNQTQQKEAGIAQEIYNLFHGIEAEDGRAKLETLINRMNPEQINQLAGIAAALA